MYGIAFGRFEPSRDIDEARLFRVSGSLTVTITSRATGRHMTLRFRCSRKDDGGPRKWPTVPFVDATRIFVDDFDGEEVAVIFTNTGVIRFSEKASANAQWVVSAFIRYLAGRFPGLTAQAEIAVASHCLRCDRELTDPESLERGFGPDCWGEVTGSRPVAATRP